jgi:hypothetical protein
MEKAKKDKAMLTKLKPELEKLVEQREIAKEQFQQLSGAIAILEKLIKDA